MKIERRTFLAAGAAATLGAPAIARGQGAAIRIGETLGISMYQGWFLDEYTGSPTSED